ncbi:hypothetical protein PoB_001175900 [Plakobranchus ocellatus]|uniref:Uncharacterized protein n=1 Tax=Plakobranchus ocellatus TaxID=259542 RepID=A0AAV3YTJ7_9GAST|nr:hypothetical protein PoB_001175900 [Plakobranchus ocellatus]
MLGGAVTYVWVFVYTVSPRQKDLRLSGPLSGRGARGVARAFVKRVPAYLRTLSTMPPTPRSDKKTSREMCRDLSIVGSSPKLSPVKRGQ